MAAAVGLAVAVAVAMTAAVEVGLAVTAGVGTGVITAGLRLAGWQAATPSIQNRLNPNKAQYQTERLLNRYVSMLLFLRLK